MNLVPMNLRSRTREHDMCVEKSSSFPFLRRLNHNIPSPLSPETEIPAQGKTVAPPKSEEIVIISLRYLIVILPKPRFNFSFYKISIPSIGA